jgi:hypothetical protein
LASFSLRFAFRNKPKTMEIYFFSVVSASGCTYGKHHSWDFAPKNCVSASKKNVLVLQIMLFGLEKIVSMIPSIFSLPKKIVGAPPNIVEGSKKLPEPLKTSPEAFRTSSERFKTLSK